MALSKLVCPECDKVLRPAKPVAPGKKVRCPKCDNVFVAGGDDEEEEDERPARKPAKKPAKAAPAPAPKKKPAGDDDDGAYGLARDPDEDDEEKKPKINYAPDTTVKDLRGPAVAKVMPPLSKLTLSGFIGVAGAVILIVLLTIPALLPIQEDAPVDPNNMTAKEKEKLDKKEKKPDAIRYKAYGINFSLLTQQPWYFFVLWLIPFILLGVYSALVTHGSILAQNLESRGWGMAASIMAMLPLNTFCAAVTISILIRSAILFVLDDDDWIDYLGGGLGILLYLGSIGSGVWSLLTLNDEEVKEGFEYEGE